MQIVSLTTDFGSKDYFSVELKAQILSKCSAVTIMDVSHEIDAHDITQAAYFLSAVYQKFPPKSIHIISVNNFYNEAPSFLATLKNGHFFIAPNNGVLSLMFDDLDPQDLYQIDTSKFEKIDLSSIFCHAAAFINHGLPLNEIGPVVTSFEQRMSIQPVVNSNQIRATIIHVDHYQNAVVNLKEEQFIQVAKGRPFEIYYKQNDPIREISEHYGSVPIGDVLARFNSVGYMEIGINMGQASSLLNLNKNESIQINFL